MVAAGLIIWSVNLGPSFPFAVLASGEVVRPRLPLGVVVAVYSSEVVMIAALDALMTAPSFSGSLTVGVLLLVAAGVVAYPSVVMEVAVHLLAVLTVGFRRPDAEIFADLYLRVVSVALAAVC